MQPHSLTRRRIVLAGAAIAAGGPVRSESLKLSPVGRPLQVAQVVDVSADQQDVSKDFLIGSRAFWQEVNARGGLRGRQVQHVAVEVDGSPQSFRSALRQLKDGPAVALSGTAGDLAASRMLKLLRDERLAIAHAAPWLQASGLETDDRTFPIFASRQEQVTHAFRSLSTINVAEVGIVYSSEGGYAAYQQELARTAADLKLRLKDFVGAGDLSVLGQRMGQDSPAILLFTGGTPELARFTAGLEKQARQRYVIALADVNLQVMMQMGGAKRTPVIATQPVPVVTASIPVVRAYREVLSRFFDEPPASLSLAGFIAARYTFEVLNEVPGEITRASALSAFQRRGAMDLGGFRVAFDGRGRGGNYVTQSMLTTDGRVIG